jgi:diguanylate cyclase (GGDEF)-like protein
MRAAHCVDGLRMRTSPPPAADPLSDEDRARDKQNAAAFWTVAAALYLVLAIAHPPTVAIGPVAGIAFVAVAMLATVVYVVHLRSAGVLASQRSIFMAAIIGAVSIGIAQWLAGGSGSPQQYLFTLTVFGCSAVLRRRYFLAYLVTVTAVCAAPLAYEGIGGHDVVGLGVFVAILWIEGMLVVNFGHRIRVQRRALYAAERISAAQAHTDPLTGLGNRRALEAALGGWFADRGPGDEITVIYLDLNGFKSYNDRFGHTAGDALLRRLGHALLTQITPADHAFRIGGDEFCAVLDGAAGSDDPAVGGVVEALSEHGPGFSIDASYGVVAVPADAADAATALRLADERMYANKGGGRVTPAEEMSALLLRVIAEREPNLHNHVIDVVKLARAVAVHLGCAGEELDMISRAAEQHDIGKLAMPDALLAKPAPLSTEEWELMHQHTIAGERILAGAPSLHEAGRIVRSSHERWDGDGYPDGLAGEAIPLGARIVCACDAYSAMRADRPYRSSIPMGEALAELKRCSGTQFDPKVVVALEREILRLPFAPRPVVPPSIVSAA